MTACLSVLGVIMSVKLPIYLDYAATTPMDERVAQKMMQ